MTLLNVEMHILHLMNLHNEIEERTIFEYEWYDSGVQTIVVGNDKGKTGGRSICIDKHYKLKYLKFCTH